MSYLIGVILIIVGLVVVIYGDKRATKNGGVITKMFSMPRFNTVFLKWAVGILCVWFGLHFLFGGVIL